MKILQLFCRYQERGGEEVAVESIGRHLRRRHQVEELYFDNAEWAALHWPRRMLIPLGFFWNPSACRRFQSAVADFQPDLIIIHNLFPTGSAAVLVKALASGIPVVYYIHNFRPFSVNGYCWAGDAIEPAGLKLNFWPEIRKGSWQHSRLKTGLFAIVLYCLHLRGMWKKIPCWIANSDFVRERFVGAGIAGNRIHTLYYGRDDRLYDEQDTGPACSAGAVPCFLFLGRLSVEKGLWTLLEAWRLYCGSGGKGFLTICGKGPLAEELALAAAELPRVILTGQVSGSVKAGLLRGCTALVVPSLWWEAFGLVVCEAYEYSKPVLAAASGGLSENVRDGKTGWVHAPGDAGQLCGHFLEVEHNLPEAVRRGENGLALLPQISSAERWLDQFQRIVAPLVNAKQEAKAGD